MKPARRNDIVRFPLWLIVSAAMLVEPVAALAAPLTYSSDATISFGSPAVNVTVAAGSVADSVVVNSTNVVVTLSGSTGGNFIIKSSSTDLSVTTIDSGGTTTLTCNAFQVAKLVISQSSGSASYTITPTGTLCTAPPSVNTGGSMPSGGGGGSWGTTAPTLASTTTTSVFAATSTTPPITNPTASSSLAGQLLQLQAQLQALLVLAQEKGVAVSTSTYAVNGASLPAAKPSAIPPSFTFADDLQLWDRGADVKVLENFLISANAGPSARALASHGASRVFGLLTYRALMEYQASVGIRPTGYLGRVTRKYIEARLKQ